MTAAAWILALASSWDRGRWPTDPSFLLTLIPAFTSTKSRVPSRLRITASGSKLDLQLGPTLSLIGQGIR